MNTKLMTMSLAALFAFGPLGAASADPKKDHDNLKISHAQTISTGQSLDATARSLMDQKKALILQLNQLIPAGTNTAWDTLFTAYNQVALNMLSGSYAQKSSDQAAYLAQLKAVTLSSTALQNQVAAILNQLQTLKAQEDAWATSLATYQTTQQNLKNSEKSNNRAMGKN